MIALATLGFATIAGFLALVLFTRLPTLSLLVLVPLLGGLAGGFAGELGGFATDGVKLVAPVAAMIMFAVLYFALMMDCGLFAPLIRRIVAAVRGDPVRLCLASAVLPMLVAFDGDGATTFLISITALLPIHRRLGLNPAVLPCIVALAAGVMNLLPWGGPTARAMSALNGDIGSIFTPVVPAMLAGIGWVLLVAVHLGRRERRRLAAQAPAATPPDPALADLPETPEPGPGGWRFGFNLGLTLLLLALLFRDLYANLLPLPPLPAPLLFIAAYAIALPVNLPALAGQGAHFARHAPAAANVVAMVLAAGIFTGILNGSGMTNAMAEALAAQVPATLAPWFGSIVAITGMPMSLMLPPDAYYFGVLPVLGQTAGAMGLDPLVAGRGAILGQMTTGFPLSPLTASTFILVGMAGISLRDHQRFTFKWAMGTTLVMTAVALATGAL